MNDPKLKKVEMLLLAVDGVLTDGGIVYSDDGSETKVFNVKDGLGIRLLQRAGIAVGIVTGRRSKALTHRCRNLGIDLLYDNIRDKAAVQLITASWANGLQRPYRIPGPGRGALGQRIVRKILFSRTTHLWQHAPRGAF